MRYYIADPHYFHKGLIDRMDKRRFSSVEEMNEHMVTMSNSRVRKNDELVILGDLSVGKWKETETILRQLNGRKHLIIGNHDKFLKDKDFDPSYFESIRPYAEMNDNKRKVILCHYPILCYNGQYRKMEDGTTKTYMLHGHVHNTLDQKLIDESIKVAESIMRTAKGEKELHSIPCHLINCFCMFGNYIPLTLDEWIELDMKRRENPVYHKDWGYTA